MSIDFFESGLLTFCHEIQGELQEIGIFHERTEASWVRSDTELQGELTKQLEQIPEEHHDEYISGYGWDLHLNQTLFPSMHREATVMSVHSYLEDTLNRLSDALAQHLNSEITYKDLKGAGIVRAKIYLTKIAGFDFEALNGTWSVLTQVNKLRNQLVHNGGYLPERDSDAVNKFVCSNKYLSGSAGEKVRISSGFVEFYINELIKFFQLLDNQVTDFTNRVSA
ncbi:hypothetical protein [Vibrio parahaemolyticus]|uniref:hypothetical protein n=1 Tax=Vibrio parahaemolyticus TaxID=670 RepID=UPI0009EFA7DF|nr:hypothetical protein [Vibrio parahaemolyticus]EJG0622505.1 hypothetical protein [Vibrio parahaemolyticus]EJG0640744.1 hypothetical protein [Vibrio parahaemolyticus]EJG0687578.1 hypothetical protein [Vibrio parahaemolyticus]EJG0702066.1 hypothetical protein [Vibrio parahaemolyticus]EJG0730696.1 hypothetical protein [Vibrio parahaemolyticus]